MKTLLYSFTVVLVLSSCGSFKAITGPKYSTHKTTQVKKKTTPVKKEPTQVSKREQTNQKSEVQKDKLATVKVEKGSEAEVILKTAKSYLGTPYKYAGMSKSGMDCSGLVYTSYQEADIQLPRISRDMANEGTAVDLSKIQPGDLVFFNTSGRGISHVGIVERVENGEVFFIHSSSSKGVIVSSLEETYWKPRFVKAKRIL